TFSEAVKQFECNFNEKAVKLHDLHHEQVKKAVDEFEESVIQNVIEKKVAPKLGPNEKKAISFLEACLSLPPELFSQEEKDLINLGKEAILKGKFQNLPREINKLRKSQTKAGTAVQPPVLIDKMVSILRKYPLEHS